MRLQLLLFVLFFSLFNTLAASEPVVINLENDRSRHLLEVKGELLKVKLCELKVGESYMVRSVMQSGSEVLLLPEIGGTATPVQSFTATASCQSLLLQRADPQSLPSMVYLSINCMSCPIQSVARPPNLQVDPGGSALSLVEDVLIGGGCFDIENASFIGNSNGVGTFGAGEASIGLEDGVIISSGNVTNAPGPNNQEGAGNDFGGGGDPDLAQLANGGAINDATGLQFEFTPTIGQIAFNYVFASEEYCEYVGSQFNDVFGFFISGPGISGGFTFDGENIAVIPGTTTPVAINTINQNMNTGFFVGNSNNCGSVANSTDIQFDGYTSVLTAVANVEPCQKYTIRLLVGDVGDGIFDSAVFLEANSFSAGGSATGEAISPTTGTNVTYEACSDGYFVLEAAGNINEDRIVEFFVSPLSTATAGADYAPLPTSVTIPAGESQVIVPITVFEDELIEGPETIILGFQNPCSCISDFIELIIEDVPPLIVDVFSTQVCAGEETNLEAIVTGGLPGYTYSWEDDNGFVYSGSTITVSPEEATAYTVTVTDECGDFEIAQAFVNVFPLPEVQIFGGGQFCGTDFSTDLQVNFSGTDGPWFFVYSIDGVFQAPIEVDTTPYFLEATEDGLYLPESVMDINTFCEGPVLGAAFIETLDFEVEFNSTNISCPGANDGAIEVNALNGISPFSYDWENVTEGVPIFGGGEEQTNLEPGIYSITAVDNQNCIDSAQIEILEPDTLRANAQIQAVPNCYNAMGGSIGLDLQGGTPGFSFLWSNADTTQNLNGLGPGDYAVTVTDSQGCLDSTSVLVEEDLEPPTVQISVEDTLTCEQDEVLINGTNSSTGNQFSYDWTGPGVVVGQTNPVVVVNDGGTYTLEITNSDNGCSASQSITVEENTVLPVANAQDDILNCYQPEVTVDADGSSTGEDYNYQWSGPNIQGGNTLAPIVNVAGNYELIVTDERNGCADSVTITIEENFDTPQAEAGTGGLLTCDEPEFTLSASVPGNTNNLSYQWSSADGNFVSGTDGLSPVVDADGVYELVVTDTVSGCSSSDQVIVNQDPNLPIAIVNGAGTLTCNVNSIELDAENSNLAPDGQYEWFTPNGQFASGTNTLTPVVNEPGDYFLVISGGPTSLCQDTAIVNIPEDTTPPGIDLSDPEVLTCDVTAFGLEADINASTGQFTTQWTGPAGSITGAEDSTGITVDAPGSYSVVVTDTNNGCVSAASVPVTQDVMPPVAAISPPSTINCGADEVDLDGSGSSTGPEFTYEWQAPDGSGLAETSNVLPAVSNPGTYTLEVLNTDNGCSSSTSAEVLVDINDPDVSIAAPDVLDCANTEFSLQGNASGTSPAPNLSYAWGTTDGGIVSGSSSLNPLIDEPGTYSLTVTDVSNNCVSTQQVTVTEDITAPTIDAGPGTTLDCQNTSYTLNGSVNSNGNFDLQWSTTDGDIASGADGLTPTITAAGTYSLEVVNLDNSCSSVSTVVIEADTDLPNISINTGGQIDCGNPTALIDASASDNGPGYQYNWTLPDGSTVSDSVEIIATSAGAYNLEIVNTDNQCINSREVLIEEDLEAPVAEAGADAILNCSNPSLQLNGSNSSQGADMIYEWRLNGTTVSTELSPVVNQPGSYELTVRNEDNQCLTTDVVDVGLDTIAPLAAVATPSEINCDVTEITIDGTASSQGNDFTYNWNSPDGNILSGNNTLNPEVDQGGTYILNVLNTENGCESTASVVVPENADYPLAEAGAPVIINCSNPAPSLDAAGSSQGAAFTYEWQGPGIVSGITTLNPVIDQPGEYTVTVYNNDNGCQSTDAVTIEQNTVQPEPVIGEPEVLNCDRTSLSIDATAGSQGPEFQYSWSTTDGNILQGDDTATPLIDEPGTYTLTVLNTDNGCSQSNSVQVEEDITAPTADVLPPATVTCAQETVTIDASASSSGPDFTYQWSTADGVINQGANTLAPVVSQGGTYQLLLTNTVNQCTETVEVIVDQDTQLPTAEAGDPVIINCYEPSPTLDATASSQGAEFEYEWNGPGITTGSNTLNPVVGQPGSYSLLITNTSNGCTATDAVTIELDTLAPSIEIAEPSVLNCALTEQTINASGSSQGAEFEYEWSTTPSGGSILSGGNTATPLIDAPGTYSLLITNTSNGCSQNSSVEIQQNIETPEIDIAAPDTLTCVVEEISIDAGASSSGAAFTYQWQVIDGNITGGSTSLSPTVDEGGVYELMILNTNNQCTNTAEVQVVQDVEIPTAEAGSTQQLNCDNPSLQLDAAGSSEGGFSYNWTGPGVVSAGTSMSPLINQPGTYQLLVTNNFNGCTAEDQVAITQDTALPSVNILEPGLLTCAVESLTLNASGSSQGNEFVYQWSTDNGSILNGADGLTPTIDQPGQYILSVFNTDNECENTDQIEVGQDIEPPVAEAGEDFLLDCWEETDFLDASGSSEGPGFQYAWATNDGELVEQETTIQPEIRAPGTYTLTVLDTGNGCSSTDEVAVTQTIPVSEVALQQPGCFGDLGNLSFVDIEGGTPPFLYSIDGGSNFLPSPDFLNLQPGDYDLVVRDVNGCEYREPAEIVQPDSLTAIITAASAELEFGDTYQINTIVNFPEEELEAIRWTNDSTLSCQDCLRPVATPFRTTIYRLEVATENGCSDRAEIRIFVNRDKPIFVPNIFSPNGDGSNDSFYIFSKPGVVENINTFQIFNRWGETVFEIYDAIPNDPDQGWDGRFRGEVMNSAVFTWYAEIEFVDGSVELFKGDVTLLR